MAATYAYFAASSTITGTSDLEVTTASLDSLSGGATNCSLDIGNLDMLQVDGTASGTPHRTNCTLSLYAVKGTNNNAVTTCTYDITYTPTHALTAKSADATSNNKAELTLQGSASLSERDRGSLSTSIYQEHDLYNITTKTTIVDDATITFTGNTTATWTFTTSFYNYNFNQNALTDSVFGGDIAIENVSCLGSTTPPPILKINDVCDSGDPLNECIANLYTSDGTNELYYHGIGKVGSAGDGSYRYAGGEPSAWSPYYFIPALYNNGEDSRIYDGSKSQDYQEFLNLLLTNGIVTIEDYDVPIVRIRNGNSYDISNDEGTFAALYEASQLGYVVPRQGVEPDNYVCFGASSCTSTDEHLYRIIGVIPVSVSGGGTQNLVKLIKADYANSSVLGTNGDYSNQSYTGSSYPTYRGNLNTIDRYYWNGVNGEDTYGATGAYNIWSYSDLNTVNLNNYYLNTYLGSTWRNKIVNVDWIVAGVDSVSGNRVASDVYPNEILRRNAGEYGNGETTYTNKIGLMYITDYAYGNSDWTGRVSWTEIGANNWLNLGLNEFTITRDSDYNSSAFSMGANGFVSTDSTDYASAVRPTFYLTSNTTYQGGSGTVSDPIIIN